MHPRCHRLQIRENESSSPFFTFFHSRKIRTPQAQNTGIAYWKVGIDPTLREPVGYDSKCKNAAESLGYTTHEPGVSAAQWTFNRSVGRWNVALRSAVRWQFRSLCESQALGSSVTNRETRRLGPAPSFLSATPSTFLSSPVGASASTEMSKANQRRQTALRFSRCHERGCTLDVDLSMTTHLGESALARHEAVRISQSKGECECAAFGRVLSESTFSELLRNLFPPYFLALKSLRLPVSLAIWHLTFSTTITRPLSIERFAVISYTCCASCVVVTYHALVTVSKSKAYTT